MPSLICQFISVWDEGETISTDARLCPHTGNISDIQQHDDSEHLGHLHESYINVPLQGDTYALDVLAENNAHSDADVARLQAAEKEGRYVLTCDALTTLAALTPNSTPHIAHLPSRSETDRARIQAALIYAAQQHAGSVRKYTGLPYITHPMDVRNRALKHYPTLSVALEMALLLHDVVEDEDATHEALVERFGLEVATLVKWLTNTTVPADGPRQIRKTLEVARLAQAPAEAQIGKCADIADNARSIALHDPHFATVYLPEKMRQLHVMRDEVKQSGLYQHALHAVQQGAKALSITLPSSAALPVPPVLMGKAFAVVLSMLERMLPDSPHALALYRRTLSGLKSLPPVSNTAFTERLPGLCTILTDHAREIGARVCQDWAGDPNGITPAIFERNEIMLMAYNFELTNSALRDYDHTSAHFVWDEMVLSFYLAKVIEDYYLR